MVCKAYARTRLPPRPTALLAPVGRCVARGGRGLRLEQVERKY